MEIYVLDSQLRRTAVIDSFDSVVWTERYNDVGDMTMNIHSTLATRTLLTSGTLLAMNKSTRVMTIETVEDDANQDGTNTLVVTANTIEILLDDRVARDSVSVGTTAEDKWIISGLPAAIARQVFQNVMVDCILDANDALPFYTAGNLYPADTLIEPTATVTVSLGIGSVLAALKTICQTYDMGFRICRNADNSQLFFNVYAGNDRTTGQTIFPAVVFAPNLDNLLDSKYLTSTKQYKNCAYIYCPDGALKVYGTGVDTAVSGFNRRVLNVNATDIKYPDRNTYGSGGTPVYAVTTAQQIAVKAVQSVTATTQFQSDSLNKIIKLQRILTQDGVNITAALANVFAFVSTEAASILAAQSVAGVTADQIAALINLGSMARLTASEASALNTMVKNNVTLTTTQKTDVTNAVARQLATVMPSEATTINAAVTTSHSYDSTETGILNALLTARGLQELAKHNNITAFDGQIPQFGSYAYDSDYFLGDITEVRNRDGVVNDVRVTEQIFAQDASGEKSYPTLSSRLVIAPNVWAARNPTQVWADVVLTEHWADL
jgi:hypothetical protein